MSRAHRSAFASASLARFQRNRTLEGGHRRSPYDAAFAGLLKKQKITILLGTATIQDGKTCIVFGKRSRCAL